MTHLTFNELRRADVERSRVSFPMCADWTSRDWACALSGEVGEACNLLKKELRDGKLDKTELAKELADAVVYIDMLAAKYDIDLAEAVVSKFNEVSVRVSSPI